MKPIRLMAGFLTVGVWTLMSRILGFVRDIVIAAKLGDGPVAEAFLIAFSLPNMFRRFFAEGAFNMAFVPMFSKKLERDEDPKGFAQDAFNGLASVLILFSLLAQAVMPWLVLAMASGFAGDERFGMAVHFGRIAFPYILFISLAALLSGVLNATGRFVAAAAAPVLLNVILVTSMLLAEATGGDFGTFLVWAVPVAGVAQLGLVWWSAARAGFRLTLSRPRLTPDMKRLARIAAPAMLAGGVVQVNLLVGRQVASYFDGAIQYLNLADRLYQLPLGVVAIAIGVVLLPDLSRRLAADDTVGGRAALNRATEFALLLTLPAAVALVVIAEPIVSVLYQRGAFGAEAAARTALVTAIYGLGLPAFVLQKVFQPLYFARHDTRTPFNYALVAMVLNAVIAIGGSYFFGFYAAAWATTLAAWAMVLLLWRGSRRMGEAVMLDDRLKRRSWRVLVACGVMAACLLATEWALGDALYQSGVRYAALLVLVGVGIVSYFGAAQLVGATQLTEIRRAMRRNHSA
ncbi:murein biosynthesis integral membrane protein MurJ [Tropicimonas sediminicola]|uniref:Probable lipid II flippase MurJ n=1 Tax=Tropicimonas sediminicola TaxID=1031541 RepID=A0A239KMK7_9RHOB|nr:murein biosynthesis integral membrane protein MurJ [Tropicimonas sediminicola]SNT18809.1 putative peptidoglycan lipid II flippase [Tropicimonas sediminicola]